MADELLVYTMSYGDWVRREAALRRMDLGELERQLRVRPLSIAMYGLSAHQRANERLEALAGTVDVITDFYEGEADVTGIFGIRLSGVYTMRGTAITYQRT